MKRLAIILSALISTLASAQQHYHIKDMWGLVTFPWDFDSSESNRIKAQAIIDARFTIIRNYSDVYVNKDSFVVANPLGSDPQFSFYEGYALTRDRRGFHPDGSFQIIQQHGIKVLQCWQNQSKGIRYTWTLAGKGSTVPYPYGADRMDPASYSDIANDAFVLASHGGTNPNVPDYTLFKAPFWWEGEQTMHKGAGMYNMVEFSNEPEMPYNLGYMNGKEIAVMLNEVYKKAKAADPNIIVSSSGISRDDTVILKEIIDYSLSNFGYIPFDIYQFHLYPSAWHLGLAGGLPPEYIMNAKAKAIVEVLKRYNIPAMVGEIGWDRCRFSWMRAPKFSNYSEEQSVGIMTVRAMVGLNEAGIKYVTWYKAFQDYAEAADSSWNQFATMGAMYNRGDSNKYVRRRTQADMGKQFVEQFGNYSFSSSLRSDTVMRKWLRNGSDSVLMEWTVESIYEGKEPGDDITVRPFWKERKVKVYHPAGTYYAFTFDSSGLLTKYHLPAGEVELTSLPIFFVPDNVVQSPLPVHLISFTAQKIKQAAVLKWIVQDAGRIEVERSGDGQSWTNLGEGILNKLVDMHPFPGKNYYRLKMYDPDESFSYSPIRVVEFKKQIRKVFVIDALGRPVLSMTTDKDLIELVEQYKSDDRLSKGMYVLRSENETEKFIKQ